MRKRKGAPGALLGLSLVIVILCATAPPASAQTKKPESSITEPSVMVAGVEVRIGAPERVVLPALRRNNKLLDLGEGKWVVVSPGSGTIDFAGGRVVKACRPLEGASRDAETLSAALWATLSAGGAPAGSKGLAVVSPSITRESITVRRLDFFMPETRRGVALVMTDILDTGQGGRQGLDVDECILAPRVTLRVEPER